MTGMELDFVFPANENGVAKALAHLHAFCRAAGISDRKCQDVDRAMSQAMNSAVEHAYRWLRGEVAVRLSADGTHLVGVVADWGRWTVDEKTDRGRDDAIVQSLSQLFERTSGPDGTIVTMTFAFAESPMTSAALVGDIITPVTISEITEGSYST
jgi:anti-sigma regulatory factor (Ser/Thr protein kinase)